MFSAPPTPPPAAAGGTGLGGLPPGDSAGGLEVSGSVALHHAVLSVSGVAVVRLPTAVGVGPAALGHREHQFRATSATGLEHGVLDLSTGISESEVDAGSGGVDHGLSVGDVASIGGRSEIVKRQIAAGLGRATITMAHLNGLNL